MRQAFEGHNQAKQFAQTESVKQGKKLSVFLTRINGIKYEVVDTVGAISIVGKKLNEYGLDPIIKPFIPPPVIEKPKEIVEEKKSEAVIPESTNETVAEIKEPTTIPVKKEEDVVVESTPTETKPKRTRKKKEGNE